MRARLARLGPPGPLGVLELLEREVPLMPRPVLVARPGPPGPLGMLELLEREVPLAPRKVQLARLAPVLVATRHARNVAVIAWTCSPTQTTVARAACSAPARENAGVACARASRART